ncbi:hypothetical protein F383_35707 [Gossypium arboreum]|uniref:Uncharacterized protein n=1 Tax=Gossypium arboreum TaxID=29729 RepID=A0A0B0N7J1_GOSAR|nr:hypothetical protein F383_35707 [Gossypium arboreum]
MSRTWHQHHYVSQSKTMSGTWHRHEASCKTIAGLLTSI